MTFKNEDAFQIKEGSNEEKTTIIFPKRGSVELENYEDENVLDIKKMLQMAFDQGYEKALIDKNFK